MQWHGQAKHQLTTSCLAASVMAAARRASSMLAWCTRPHCLQAWAAGCGPAAAALPITPSASAAAPSQQAACRGDSCARVTSALGLVFSPHSAASDNASLCALRPRSCSSSAAARRRSWCSEVASAARSDAASSSAASSDSARARRRRFSSAASRAATTPPATLPRSSPPLVTLLPAVVTDLALLALTLLPVLPPMLRLESSACGMRSPPAASTSLMASCSATSTTMPCSSPTVEALLTCLLLPALTGLRLLLLPAATPAGSGAGRRMALPLLAVPGAFVDNVSPHATPVSPDPDACPTTTSLRSSSAAGATPSVAGGSPCGCCAWFCPAPVLLMPPRVPCTRLSQRDSSRQRAAFSAASWSFSACTATSTPPWLPPPPAGAPLLVAPPAVWGRERPGQSTALLLPEASAGQAWRDKAANDGRSCCTCALCGLLLRPVALAADAG